MQGEGQNLLRTTVNTSASPGLCYTLFFLAGNPSPASLVVWATWQGCCALLSFPVLHSLDRCSPKAQASRNITIIEVILTANTPVDVKVRLGSCWPGEEKGYCCRYWFGSAELCGRQGGPAPC